MSDSDPDAISPINPGPPVPGWEYLVEDFLITNTSAEWSDHLNALGVQGWEMVWLSNIVTDDTLVRIWFKREI